MLVPWQQYEWTGRTEVLQRAYEGMKRYVDYLGHHAENGIVSYGLGDWFDLGPKPPGVARLTPIALTATAFYFQDATLLARTAKLLGKSDDATRYVTLATQIRDAFNAKYFQVETARYATGSQTADALALAMESDRPSRRAGSFAAFKSL